MSILLGIDTSNYTTSTALLKDGAVLQQKKLLPVADGERGLRQSDAVFHHVRQLPELLETLLGNETEPPAAVGVSDRPTEADGSYMPCFLAGAATARGIAASARIPLFRFTHQQGHIAAAAYGAGQTELLDSPFLAFHVSGGTTEALYVTPHDESVISCRRVAGSLDLKAGQLIDRVGVRLGLSFPCGAELEKLALCADETYRIRPVMRDGDCCLSGAENQCADMIAKGAPREEVALFCLMQVYAAVRGMTERLLLTYGDLPVLYAGGVMSNTIIAGKLRSDFGGRFAPPAFSADNAAGIALLSAKRRGEWE